MSSSHCLRRGLLIAALLFLSLFILSCEAEQENNNSVGSRTNNNARLRDAINLVCKEVTDNLVTVGNFTTSAYQKIETSIYNAINESSFVHQLVQEATGTILIIVPILLCKFLQEL